MKSIKREVINSNSRRIWGHFILSDKSKTQFEMIKGEGWNQWGNTTDNLCVTVDRLNELASEWFERFY